MDDETLTHTLCRLLADDHGWFYDETGLVVPPDDAEVVVFYGELGTAPDQAVGVQLYSPTDDAVGNAPSVRRAQVRLRGGAGMRNGADTLSTAAFNSLQGLTRVVGIAFASRNSSAYLGADTVGRQERTDNYTIILDNVEA